MFIKSSLKYFSFTHKCDCCGKKIKQGYVLQFGVIKIVLCKKCNDGIKEMYKYKSDLQHCVTDEGEVY